MARKDSPPKPSFLRRVADRLRRRSQGPGQSHGANAPDPKSTSAAQSPGSTASAAPPSLSDTSRLSQEALASIHHQPFTLDEKVSRWTLGLDDHRFESSPSEEDFTIRMRRRNSAVIFV